ncbi:MAG TPA: dTDP-4-dehydrorhamnose 3,5-epimerase [Chryseolinea sp.]|nr:dTDP-4-dehydrorhamnose 3,5-epimerase [Chryseolinea sp.]
MKVTQTGFKGLVVLEPAVFNDSRGQFLESYNARTLQELGLEANFIQDNQSYSTAGVVRGLHYQNEPHAQTKLVRVLAGVIWDVVVDLRKNEPTFGQVFGIELSAESKRQLYVPKGFAHGFSVLGKSAEIMYKCDNYYNREAEGGILYNDPALGIDWKIKAADMIVSEKDARNHVLEASTFNF